MATVLVPGRAKSIGDYAIEFSWGARAETIEGCARRWLTMLHAIALCDPELTRWFDAVTWPPEEVRLEPAAFVELLRAHPMEREQDDERYVLMLDSDKTRQFERVTVWAGSGCAPGLGGNGGFFNIWRPAEADSSLLSPPSLRCIFEAAIDAWRPVWGEAKPTLLRQAFGAGFSDDDTMRVEAGWLTYLAVPPARLPTLPAGAEAVPFADGVLIIATPAPFRADDPEHVQAIERIQTLLDQSGLAVVQL